MYCSSCVDGYVLQGSKCVSDRYLSCTTTLDMNINDFYLVINDYIDIMLSKAGLGANRRLFIIISIVTGSVEVTSSISVDDQDADSV